MISHQLVQFAEHLPHRERHSVRQSLTCSSRTPRSSASTCAAVQSRSQRRRHLRLYCTPNCITTTTTKTTTTSTSTTTTTDFFFKKCQVSRPSQNKCPAQASMLTYSKQRLTEQPCAHTLQQQHHAPKLDIEHANISGKKA